MIRTSLLACLFLTTLLPTAAADHGYDGPFSDTACHAQRTADLATGAPAQECPPPDAEQYADDLQNDASDFLHCVQGAVDAGAPLDALLVPVEYLQGGGDPLQVGIPLEGGTVDVPAAWACAYDLLQHPWLTDEVDCTVSVLDGGPEPRLRFDPQKLHLVVDPGLQDEMPSAGRAPGVHFGAC